MIYYIVHRCEQPVTGHVVNKFEHIWLILFLCIKFIEELYGNKIDCL
jgi:hypothetical protein